LWLDAHHHNGYGFIVFIVSCIDKSIAKEDYSLSIMAWSKKKKERSIMPLAIDP